MNVGIISMLMQKSTISILFVVLLVVFFIALVAMTIALAASKSDKSEDDYDEDDYDDEDDSDDDDDKVDIGSIFAEADKEVKGDSVFTDSAFADSAFADSAFTEDSAFTDSAFTDSAFTEDSAFTDSAFTDSAFAKDSAFTDSAFAKDSAFADSAFADSAFAENNAAEDENIGQIALSKSDDDIEDFEEYHDEVGPTDELVATKEQMEFVERIKQRDAEQAAALSSDSAFADSDSAFNIQTKPAQLSSEEIDASVKEAMALGEALVSGSKSGINTMADHSSRGKKKRSNVPSTDEFYWFNKRDVSEKPAYKTREMYYHYFNVPEDCIEDLLMEMYDCALVRTEEIRYIAYGIEPRPMSMKELMATSNKRLNQQKIKTPSQQDLLLIYDKWCSYVDALFETIEMHADDYTTERIRSLLCEFGRSDVDEILEGK